MTEVGREREKQAVKVGKGNIYENLLCMRERKNGHLKSNSKYNMQYNIIVSLLSHKLFLKIALSFSNQTLYPSIVAI